MIERVHGVAVIINPTKKETGQFVVSHYLRAHHLITAVINLGLCHPRKRERRMYGEKRERKNFKDDCQSPVLCFG